MPRKIEFDYAPAIDRATQLFWRKGYSRTSLRDLLKTMGIGEGSFYNTIKSKKHLYLECLKHYEATVGRRRLNPLLSRPSAKEGIRAYFKGLLDELDDPKTPRVCLLFRSLSGDVMEERELKKAVLTDMNALHRAFSERMRVAKERGELPEDFDVQVVTQVIVTYLQGWNRAVLVPQSRAETERQIETLLTGLGL